MTTYGAVDIAHIANCGQILATVFVFLTTYLATSGSKAEKIYGNNGPKATKNATKTPAERAKKRHSQQKDVVKYFWELDVAGSISDTLKNLSPYKRN